VAGGDGSRVGAASVVPRERLLALAAASFAAIFMLRVADQRPGDAILVLCVVPIALCASAHGPRGGVLAGLIGVALTGAWAIADSTDVGPLGYAARAVAFLVVGVVVGRYAERARGRAGARAPARAFIRRRRRALVHGGARRALQAAQRRLGQAPWLYRAGAARAAVLGLRPP
jgi:hypothetical protein